MVRLNIPDISYIRQLVGHQRPDQVETVQVGWFTPEQVRTIFVHPMMVPLNKAILEHLGSGAFIM